MLQTLPWARVDIELVSVETDLAGRVMEGTRGDIIQYMGDQGYIHRCTIWREPGRQAPTRMAVKGSDRNLSQWSQLGPQRSIIPSKCLHWPPLAFSSLHFATIVFPVLMYDSY